MLKIQVLGSGLVPRIGRLAPIKDPFPADKTLIGTIFATSKMKINYLHPRTNKLMPLTRNNFAEVWDEYGEEEYVSSSPVDPSKVETKKQQEVSAQQKNEIPEKEKEVSPVIKEEKEKSEDEILEEMLKEDEKNKADKNNKKKH